ncbi:MAG: hypothetical protein ACM3MG_02560 [Bacillota bacterium]
MGILHSTLKDIRSGLGYTSAKTFFKYLQSRGVECNYPYYMKIEGGNAFPSSALINQIAKALPGNESVTLIKVFCADQFADFKYLFEVDPPMKNDHSADTLNEVAPQGRRELSMRQISVIAKSMAHYHTFLLCTLARRALKINELQEYFAKKILTNCLQDFLDEGLLVETTEGYRAFSTDVIFPTEKSPALLEYYKLFDEWDIRFGEQFELTEVIGKMQIRRISFRYLGLIQKQLELLFETIRSSDETDLRHNSQVIQLQVNLKKGTLPG